MTLSRSFFRPGGTTMWISEGRKRKHMPVTCTGRESQRIGVTSQSQSNTCLFSVLLLPIGRSTLRGQLRGQTKNLQLPTTLRAAMASIS